MEPGGGPAPGQGTDPPKAAGQTWTPMRRWPDIVLLVLLALALAGLAYERMRLGRVSDVAAGLVLLLLVLMALRMVLLARENRSLAARFQASDDFKTQLLRFISHEIANPLSPLKVQVRLLQTGAASTVDKAWQAVERSIGRLESLSRDVRLMALAETRRIVQKTEPADLAPRIVSAVQAHQAVAAQRGIVLRPDIQPNPLVIPIDGERFDQVVDNLLSNALKFTPKGGTIDVRLFRSPGGTAVFEVIDSGAGMSVEQQGRLFSAFGRPQGSTTPGLGLGLYLCKAIVDGHGGRISASSEGPGRGSRFRVELPAAVAAAKARTGPPPKYTPAHHAGGPGVPDTKPPDLPV